GGCRRHPTASSGGTSIGSGKGDCTVMGVEAICRFNHCGAGGRCLQPSGRPPPSDSTLPLGRATSSTAQQWADHYLTKSGTIRTSREAEALYPSRVVEIQVGGPVSLREHQRCSPKRDEGTGGELVAGIIGVRMGRRASPAGNTRHH